MFSLAPCEGFEPDLLLRGLRAQCAVAGTRTSRPNRRRQCASPNSTVGGWGRTSRGPNRRSQGRHERLGIDAVASEIARWRVGRMAPNSGSVLPVGIAPTMFPHFKVRGARTSSGVTADPSGRRATIVGAIPAEAEMTISESRWGSSRHANSTDRVRSSIVSRHTKGGSVLPGEVAAGSREKQACDGTHR